MHTFDTLIDPNRREITTTWTTDLRVNEGTYDAGTVRVALSTTHDKSRKRLETRINREVVTDSGFVTRSFVLLAKPTADSGITLATEPVARFNAGKARDLHQFILLSIAEQLAAEQRHPDVAAELAGLIARKVVAA